MGRWRLPFRRVWSPVFRYAYNLPCGSNEFGEIRRHGVPFLLQGTGNISQVCGFAHLSSGVFVFTCHSSSSAQQLQVLIGQSDNEFFVCFA